MQKPVPKAPAVSHWPKRMATIGALLVSGSAMAQGYMGQDGTLVAKYRCGVLGDTSQCTPVPKQPSPREEERVILGPYARYLIHLGTDPAKAVQQARAIGEAPTLQRVRITTRALTSAEKYDRVNGRYVEPETRVEVLSVRAIGEAEALAMF